MPPGCSARRRSATESRMESSVAAGGSSSPGNLSVEPRVKDRNALDWWEEEEESEEEEEEEEEEKEKEKEEE